jgi:hypothetical protein
VPRTRPSATSRRWLPPRGAHLRTRSQPPARGRYPPHVLAAHRNVSMLSGGKRGAARPAHEVTVTAVTRPGSPGPHAHRCEGLAEGPLEQPVLLPPPEPGRSGSTPARRRPRRRTTGDRPVRPRKTSTPRSVRPPRSKKASIGWPCHATMMPAVARTPPPRRVLRVGPAAPGRRRRTRGRTAARPAAGSEGVGARDDRLGQHRFPLGVHPPPQFRRDHAGGRLGAARSPMTRRPRQEVRVPRQRFPEISTPPSGAARVARRLPLPAARTSPARDTADPGDLQTTDQGESRSRRQCPSQGSRRRVRGGAMRGPADGDGSAPRRLGGSGSVETVTGAGAWRRDGSRLSRPRRDQRRESAASFERKPE